MDVVRDEDRRRRLRMLEERVKDPRSITNIDCLLDTVQALVADCDHPSVKRMKNIEAYMNRCEYLTFLPVMENILIYYYNSAVIKIQSNRYFINLV